ncbi:MAG: hypothetical protein PHQ43_13695, partial [Dehalococcoidales bacterium]|nr:hypothetical protein [Dehalococcoidales bacterium]
MRFDIQNNNWYLVRVASPAHVTFLSDTLLTDKGNISFALPPPIPRPRIGSWRLGCVLSQHLPDSLYEDFTSIAHGSLTTISPDLLNNERLTRIVSAAHVNNIEVTARVPVTASDTPQILSIADSAEVYCVDGVVVLPDSSLCASPEFGGFVRQLASSLHERGLTLAVQFLSDCGADSIIIPSGIPEVMTLAPPPETPDELRISFTCAGIQTSVTTERIEEKINELVRKHIPLSRITVELILSGFKFRFGDNGNLEPEKPEQGEIQDIIRDSGGYGIVRLRDGTLRLGFKGSLYIFDDCEGRAQKIGVLRTDA